MLNTKSLQIGLFGTGGIAGLLLLMVGLSTITFEEPLYVKLAILIIAFFLYLIIYLIFILFLKVYEKPPI